jgi:hypothetical protein
MIWKIKAPPGMKVFVWLGSLNKLLTIDKLIKRDGVMQKSRLVQTGSAGTILIH